MNIYMIANENMTDDELNIINNFKLNNLDKVIRFNNARDERIFNGRCDILYSRCNEN